RNDELYAILEAPVAIRVCALQVNQGNMPGIQSTFLAMDTEEGVEVVWNELHFTDKKAFKAHEVSGSFLLPCPVGTQLAGKAPFSTTQFPETPDLQLPAGLQLRFLLPVPSP
uniref:Uncharacterized protein n=1 Tax=Gopherus agassizii TaxID=38772 RepID=A0A452I244_9SAUR